MVKSVEVLAESVHTVMAMEYAVGIEYRYDEKIEVASEFDSLVVIAGEKLEHAV